MQNGDRMVKIFWCSMVFTLIVLTPRKKNDSRKPSVCFDSCGICFWFSFDPDPDPNEQA